MKTLVRLAHLCGLASLALPLSAQVNSQSDGSDGAFNPASNTTVNLDLAPTVANYLVPGTGNGVYDPARWAVVFKFTSVNIAAGRTVTFANHRTTAPVVWLVQGDVTIAGTLDLDAQYAPVGGGQLSIPGPGGFRGASDDPAGLTRGAGYGPGGSTNSNGYGSEGASYATQPTAGSAAGYGPVYGNPQILPLIGGSGSKVLAGNQWPGGAGGGAILIVANGTITVNGTIRSTGSSAAPVLDYNSGSGGAVRLVANSFAGAGSVTALSRGSTGGVGRIRIERLQPGGSFAGTVNPVASSIVLPDPNPILFPTSTHPTLTVTHVDNVPVPADPLSNFNAPDLQIAPAATSIVRLQATNVPTDGSWRVQVRVVPRSGVDRFANATFISGNQGISTWEATIAIPAGGSAVIARAYRL